MDNYVIIGSVLIGLLVLLLAYIFLFKKGTSSRRHKRGNKIYLLGPKGCGKTQLFHQLVQPDQPLPQTLTTLTPHEYPIGKYTLVDTPGHPKLRPEINSLTSTRLFVLWIAPASLKDDVEYVLGVLVHCHRHKIPLYIIASQTSETEIGKACEEAIKRMLKTGQEDADLEYQLDECKFFTSPKDLASFLFE